MENHKTIGCGKCHLEEAMLTLVTTAKIVFIIPTESAKPAFGTIIKADTQWMSSLEVRIFRVRKSSVRLNSTAK